MSVLTLVPAATRDLFADAPVPARAPLPLRLVLVPAQVQTRVQTSVQVARTLGDPQLGHRVATLAQAVPGVWQADALHTEARAQVQASGHAALDAELPGGGWPQAGLIELLLPGVMGAAPLWPLLLPALMAQQRSRRAARRGGTLVLVGTAAQPYLPALAAAGLLPDQLLWLPDGAAPASQLWAAEQALRCVDVAAVLAWLPRARQAELRRLHLAAAQRGDGLLWVMRPAQAAASASPAPLRLQLALGQGAAVAADGMPSLLQAGDALAPLEVRILKRRGPPLAQPLLLPAQGRWLRAALAAQALQRAGESAQGEHKKFAHAASNREGHHDGHADALARLAVAA